MLFRSKAMKQVRKGGSIPGMSGMPGMSSMSGAMPPIAKSPVMNKKKSKSGNPAKRALEEGR